MLIDEGLLLSFSAPNSFTGDNLVEFHIHGSNAVISYFLKVLSEQDNCRLAEPGEFTKIAFQNNKIDLIEAESIGDLIHSETELQRKQAVKLVQGNASNYYNDLRAKLIKSLAYIEAKIDFAEDDLPESVLKEVQESIKTVQTDIKKILEDHKTGEKIRDGFRVFDLLKGIKGHTFRLNDQDYPYQLVWDSYFNVYTTKQGKNGFFDRFQERFNTIIDSNGKSPSS